MATSFSAGGNRSTRRKPPTLGKQLVASSLAAAIRVHHFCNLQEQITQLSKEKVQNDKQRSTRHTHTTDDRITPTPTENLV